MSETTNNRRNKIIRATLFALWTVCAAATGFWLRERNTQAAETGPIAKTITDSGTASRTDNDLPEGVRWLEFSAWKGPKTSQVKSVTGKTWCRGRFGSLGAITIATELLQGTIPPEVGVFLYTTTTSGFRKEPLVSFNQEEHSDGPGLLKDLFLADIDQDGSQELVAVAASPYRCYFEGEGGFAGIYDGRSVIIYRILEGRVQEDETFAPPFALKLWRRGMEAEDERVVAEREHYYLRQFERKNLRVLLQNHFGMK